MIITDLYQTKIECSTYNTNIDDDTITVTVTLKDFNNNNVTGKNITLSCDKGFFTKCIGATKQTIDNVVTKSVTSITNNNGQITATWTASEWGLCTFTANNSNIQINVTGWKEVYNNNGVTVAIDGRIAYCSWSISERNIPETSKLHVTLPSELRPKNPIIHIGHHGNPSLYISINGDGQFKYWANSARTNALYGYVFYFLATPYL